MRSNLLNECLSEQILRAIDEGSTKNFSSNEPFNYAYIENLLTPELFAKIKQEYQALMNFEKDPGFEVFHTHLNIPSLLRLFYSPSFYQFLKTIFDLQVSRKKDQFPSLRMFKNGSDGMEIHNDGDFVGNMTAFLYLEDWQPGMGGEVILYKKGKKAFKRIISVPPKGNSMLLMPIQDRNSFHSVRPLNLGWERTCAFFPYQIRA